MIMQRTGLTLLTESWQAFADCVEQCVQCFQTRRMLRPRLSADCVSVRTIHRRHDQRTAWHRYLVAGGRSRRASVLSATNRSHLPDLTSRVRRRPHQRLLLLLGAGMGSWLSTDTTAGVGSAAAPSSSLGNDLLSVAPAGLQSPIHSDDSLAARPASIIRRTGKPSLEVAPITLATPSSRDRELWPTSLSLECDQYVLCRADMNHRAKYLGQR